MLFFSETRTDYFASLCTYLFNIEVVRMFESVRHAAYNPCMHVSADTKQNNHYSKIFYYSILI